MLLTMAESRFDEVITMQRSGQGNRSQRAISIKEFNATRLLAIPSALIADIDHHQEQVCS